MEAITIAAVVGFILIGGGVVWKLMSYIRNIELQITNHQRHQIMNVDKKLDKIDQKIDSIKDDVNNIKERVIKLEK